MEGNEMGRPRGSRRSKSFDASILESKLCFEKWFARRNGNPCIWEIKVALRAKIKGAYFPRRNGAEVFEKEGGCLTSVGRA